MERQREEESEAADGNNSFSSRRIVNKCYDNLQAVQPDFFTQILEVFFKRVFANLYLLGFIYFFFFQKETIKV